MAEMSEVISLLRIIRKTPIGPALEWVSAAILIKQC